MITFQRIRDEQQFATVAIKTNITDTVRYTDELFDFALECWASDIHIECPHDYVLIRYRENGDFVYVDKLNYEEYTKINSRIKVLSGLRIDEKLRPQDGKIAYTSQKMGETVDIRVSVLPVVYGEKIVMRFLRQDSSLLSLDRLDFMDLNLDRIRESMKSHYGIILIAGPTGSWKTTTLFSMLKEFKPLEYNISTLEDPVEYNMPFVNQSQVKPEIGYDFAAGLRSMMRQDPDIIMVGEIRDRETAMLAIEAALTGHMVFSTIHTNSAAATVQRLVNMGIEPYLVASALKMVVSQRLIRRVCPNCVAYAKVNDHAKQELIREQLEAISDEQVGDLQFAVKVWCDQCDNTGYQKRIAAHEVLTITEELHPMILGKMSAIDIERKAREQGMLTILQDGLIKAIMWKTTLSEALQLI